MKTIGFAFSNNRLGGNDRSIFLWKTDCVEEAQERCASFPLMRNTTADRNQFMYICDVDQGRVDTRIEALDINDIIVTENCVRSSGDEFMSIKPWMGAICAPSNVKGINDNHGLYPEAELKLKHVYGYCCERVRNNVFFTDKNTEIVYHSAAIGIVQSLESGAQYFNTDHTDDIISIALHPKV